MLRKENDNHVILHEKLIYFQQNKNKNRIWREIDSEFKSNNCSA